MVTFITAEVLHTDSVWQLRIANEVVGKFWQKGMRTMGGGEAEKLFITLMLLSCAYSLGQILSVFASGIAEYYPTTADDREHWSIFIASDNFPSSLLTAFVTFSAWKMRPFRALYVMQMWSVLCVKRWNMTPHFCQDRTPRNSWQLLGLTAELH